MTAFSEHRSAGIAISSIVLAELEFGLSKSQAKDKNRTKLMNFLSTVDVLHFDSAAAMEYGEIRAQLQRRGQPIGPMDMLIAPTPKPPDWCLSPTTPGSFRAWRDLRWRTGPK